MDADTPRPGSGPRRAAGLPAGLVGDPAWRGPLAERVLARTWHVVAGDTAGGAALEQPGRCQPATLLPGELDEPLLLARDAGGTLRCLSNVCTHRGALVCEQPGSPATLRCRYHGRRFGLDGTLLAAPGFEQAQGFPAPEDDLPRVAHARWGPLHFAAIDPAMPFDALTAELDALCTELPLSRARLDPSRCRDYDVPAHWILYCDNYLEGFHVPFVHPALAGAIDGQRYELELQRWSSVQTAYDREDPTRPAGRFVFLFPTTMINVYPWGLSVNLVRPTGPARTTVLFRTWVWDAARLGRGAGADLHTVEREDEAVVASVQRGIRSRVYRGGRCAPRHEACVDHFHRLLAELLGAGG
jgi:choline monooxygenase